MAKGKSSLAQAAKELEEKPVKEFDPEENQQPGTDESGSENEEDENLGTEHYVEVGKSKLRKPVELALGPQYAGARVSRKDLMNEDDDDEEEEESDDEDADNYESIVDPDTVDLDADDIDGEIDSDEALGESDDEKFKEFVFRGSGKPKVPNKRMTAADFISSSEDEVEDMEDAKDGEESEGEQDEEDEDDNMMDADDVAEEIEIEGEDVSDSDSSGGGIKLLDTDEEEEDDDSENEDQSDVDGEQDDADDDEEEEESESEGESDDDSDAEGSDEESARRAELKKMMSEEQKTVVATISQAAKADQEKGIAVKAQRKTFDSLLNVRIRLQKALVATNSMAASEDDVDASTSTPYKAAEEAAVKLLNTLNSMRHSLSQTDSGKTSKKRKLSELTTATPSTDIWAALQSAESQSLPKRQATLEKWSNKVRGTTATPVSRKLNNIAESSLTDVLATSLSGTNGERLVQRTHMPRSCAPVQVRAKLVTSDSIFDDADFYQLLLKELVDQRMVEAGSAPAGALGAPVAQWAAVKEAKTKRQVDTKASKGRKMKFTVHEKLQNFMAPEDRGSWEQEAVDRFFGTLLGQRMGLGEESEDESEEEEKLGEEEALMLFRS